MKRKLPAIAIAMLLLLTGFGGGAGESAVQETTEDTTPAAPLTMTFMKVGKADAMILQTENHTVVIDCGEKSDGKKVVSRLQESGIDTIDYLILTHYDQDHIGGAAKVVENFSVGHIIGADYEENSPEYETLKAEMDEKGYTFESPQDVTEFTLDDATITLYPHETTDYKDGYDNNCSIVTKVTHHQETFLLAPDAMQERLSEIMDIGDCDLLKVPYHGREIANLPQFLAAVTPEYAVVSTSENELSAATMKQLTECGAQTYITFCDGTVIAESDGKSISVTTEPVE